MYTIKGNTLFSNGKKVCDFDTAAMVRNTRYFYKDGVAVANVNEFKISQTAPETATSEPPPTHVPKPSTRPRKSSRA